MWLNSDKLKKRYMRIFYCNLKFHVWKYDMSCASEKIIMVEVSGQTSGCYVFRDVNSILFTAHPMTVIWLNVLNVFHGEKSALFTVTSIHSIPKSTKNRNSETKWNPRRKATENSTLKQVKNREIELINKKAWRRKEKKKCSIQEFDWYIMRK